MMAAVRRPTAKNRRHHLWLTVLLPVVARMKLLDIGQIQRAFRRGPFGIAAHVKLHIPVNLERLGNHRVLLEDATAGKIAAQPLKHDDVRRNQQESFGIIRTSFDDSVQILPGDGQGHDFGLAAAGGHLGAVTGKRKQLWRANFTGQIGRDKSLIKRRQIAGFGDLEDINQGLDGSLLGVVIGKFFAIGQLVVGMKPVIQQNARGFGRAFIMAFAPIRYLSADGGDGRRGFAIIFQKAHLRRAAFRSSSEHAHLTLTGIALVVSLPKMSITFTSAT